MNNLNNKFQRIDTLINTHIWYISVNYTLNNIKVIFILEFSDKFELPPFLFYLSLLLIYI